MPRILLVAACILSLAVAFGLALSALAQSFAYSMNGGF